MSVDRSIATVGLYASARDLLRSTFTFGSDISRSGFQLLAWGTAVAALQQALYLAFAFIDRTFIARTTIDSRDEAFQWLVEYLRSSRKDSLHFTISTQNTRNTSESSVEDGPSNTNAIKWVPAPGWHFLTYDNRPILIRRNLNGEQSQSNLWRPSEKLETLSISTIAMHPKILHSLVTHARKLFLENDQSRTIVHSGNQHGGWQRLQSRPIRPLSTVIISPAVMTPLLDDIRNYLSLETEVWYASRGIPYRRGYLFFGLPGTGKSSLAVGLAGEFKLGVYVVNLAGKGMSDETLMELLGDMPRRSILLLEDIDAAFRTRATTDEKPTKNAGSNETSDSVTSSGLLNALDGVAAQEGRIVILTTNYIDHIDAALIRPGRIDRKIEFTNATHEDVKALFRNFFGNEMGTLADTFANKVTGEFSIAALQGYLLTHRHDPEAAVQHIEAWQALQTQSSTTISAE